MNQSSVKGIFIALFASILVFFLVLPFFSAQHALLIGVIALLVVLWTNEGLPLGVVSLLPILLFPMLGILSVNATVANYSKSTIFLFLGGFMLAIATEKIGLHTVIANKLLSLFPNTPRGIMFSLGLTAAVISGLVANTTTTLLLVPIALFLSEKRDLKMRFVLSVAYGATIGGIMTPIGTPPNAILMGFLEDQNLEALPFVGWMGLTIPLAIAMLLIMPYILSFGLKNIPLQQPSGTTTLNGEQKRLVYILVAMIFLLLINSPIKPYYTGLGLNEKAILLGAGLLMFFPKIGFLEWTDARKIPYEIMFLFGAGFSIAKAFSATGLAKTVASLLLGVTSFGPVLLLFIVALLIASTTELTSNTALTSIALPIIFALGQQVSSVSTNLMLMVATVCASYAFMLPIATPPNAIAAGSGAVRTKDMIKFGVYLNIVGIVLIVIFANVFWVYFLK